MSNHAGRRRPSMLALSLALLLIAPLAFVGATPARSAPTGSRVPTVSARTVTLATTWYFAEGFTGAGFDEYLTINNPGDAGKASITYFVEGQTPPITRSVPLAARSRTTVRVHDPPSPANPGGLGRLAVGHATTVESTIPVVVERPMYFTYASGVQGGHNVLGANAPATS